LETCSKCGICKYTKKQCNPKGSANPIVYFCGEAPGPEENEQGVPFVGRAGKYLSAMLDGLGLNENNCRFYNTVRCYPQVSDMDYGFRTPTEEEIGNCIHYVNEDIMNTSPKVIVTLGNTPSRAFIGEKFTSITKCHGQIYHVEIENTEYIVIPAYHPSYVMRQSKNISIRLEFKKDIQLAISIGEGNNTPSVSISNKDNYKEFGNETVLCLTYKEFDNFCKEEIDNSETCAYDIETNAREVRSSDHHVVGFSLASRAERGCYVVMNSLDYTMSDIDRKCTEARLRKILLIKKSTMVFNCMHELPATLNWLRVTIPNIDDIFVKVKLMMANAAEYAGSGGLKIQCVTKLGVKDWSADLDLYFDMLRNLDKNRDNMRNLVSKYYDSSEVQKTMDEIERIYKDPETFSNEVISYGLVPFKLIGKYGATDSAILYTLNDYYDKLMTDEGNKLGVDLFKGYNCWMHHHIAGFLLERNGAFWNEDHANELSDWCNTGMQDSLKEMIFSQLSDSYIRSKLEYDFSQYLKDNYLDVILGTSAVPKRMYKNSVSIVLKDDGQSKLREDLKMMSLVPNDKGIIKLELGNIITLSKLYISNHKEIYDKWYSEYMSNFRENNHTIKEMKDLLNPTSTNDKFREFVSGILVTEDITYAKLYASLLDMISMPDFNIDSKYDNSGNLMYTGDDRSLLSLVVKLSKMDIPSRSKLSVIVKFLSSGRNFKSWKVRRLVSDSLGYSLTSTKDEYIIEMYNLFVLCGIDIDNEETWTEQFRWFYNFRLYKKYSKILSTYINGKVGRDNVWLVDEKSYRNGDPLTRRETRYFDAPNVIVPGKMLAYQSEFHVNMAASGRWKCLTGDTLICLAGGSTVMIKDLLGKSGFFVKSYNGSSGLIVNGFCNGCAITGYNVKVVKVVIDDGNYFRCTHDHRIMMSNGYYKEASNLSCGDIIMTVDSYHTVKYVIEQPYTEDFVYDLDIDTYHNFVISLGRNDKVIVHNSGFHTLSSTVKYIYTSRFKHGIIAAPDASACFTGDTNIVTSFNDSLKISKISDLVGSEFKVTSYDTSTSKFVEGHAHDCRIVRYANIIEYITWSNDKTTSCTADHRFLVYGTEEYIYASDIIPGVTIIRSVYSKRYMFAKRIRVMHLENPVPVYCFEVDNWNNFLIGDGVISHNCEVKVLAAQAKEKNLLDAIAQGLDLHRFTASKIYHCTQEQVTSIQRKCAKAAVFGIIYGEAEKSFADSSCHGNMDEAKAIFGELFGNFPGIKDYIDESHKQYLETGKVTLPITGRFINVDDMDGGNNGGDKDRVLRQSQNVRIQGQAGDICGEILYKIFSLIEENNMKSKPFCYIHDSIEIDIHPEEVFKMIDIASYAFNKFPSEHFNVPISSDVVIGPSMGQEISVEELNPSKDFKEAEIVLKGFEDDIDELESIWKDAYRVVDRDTEFEKDIEPKEVLVPRSGLFQKKVNLSSKMGTKRIETQRKYKVIIA
jgi:DNA polymerase